MKILILDNVTEQRNKIKAWMAEEEYQVVEAGDAEIARELLFEPETEPFRIVLADFEMPDFNGLELINTLLAADIEYYPYIIFMIDRTGERRVIDSLGPIPGDFLFKPVTEDELKARMMIAERTIALQTRLHDNTGHSESLAIYDQLTSVLNRQAVYERALAELNRSQREGLPLSLAMVEIVNLESIRESYGPQVRDQAVRFVARASRANVRIYDLVGRWIGAKFLVMLPGASAENALSVVNRINTAISSIRIRVPEGERVQLDVRIGFTNIEKGDTQPLYLLIEQANEALNTAINTQQDPVVHYQPAS